MTAQALPATGLVPRRAGGPACSTASRAAEETLVATAGLGRRWLLVEVAGAWGPNAFTDSPVLDPGIGRRIVARAEHAGLRVVALRRPGRERGAPRWRWAVADTAPGAEQVVWGEAATPEQLLDVPLDGSTGTPSAEPVVLVCTHGRHDECCAVRGRSVAASLAQRHRAATWECSHLGGCRYAATLLLLPHGLHYGRVDDLDVEGVFEAYARGEVVLDGLRGRTAFSRVVQAAQDAARRRTGDLRVDSFAPRSVEPAGAGWRVVLEGEPPLEVAVEERRGGALLTTCAATTPVRVAHLAPREPRGNGA